MELMPHTGGEIHLSYDRVLTINWLSIPRKRKRLPADKFPRGTLCTSKEEEWRIREGASAGWWDMAG